MIYGTGIDIVDIPRMEQVLRRRKERFVERVFSPAEIAYCDGHPEPAMHYAARFAAKESLLKALGIGLGMGLHLSDIDVSTDERGKPGMRLLGSSAEILQTLGICRVHVSLSHTHRTAVAVVVLETLS